MNISEMSLNDVVYVLPLYIEYYNDYEGCCWTEETAKRRIRQVLSIEDSYSLIMKDDEGKAVGFVMGYFKQYYDIMGYTLEEIVISFEHQNKGLGSALLKEIENRVKKKGASCVELQAVNDEKHERYYSKAGYKNAVNFVMKVKWFQ